MRYLFFHLLSFELLDLDLTGSSFAGNPYFISPDTLAEEGLLTGAEAEEAVYEGDGNSVPYAWLFHTRYTLLRKAFQRWKEKSSEAEEAQAYNLFLKKNSYWLLDYALFMALKEAHGGAGFREWEQALCMREQEAVEKARNELADEIGFQIFLQYTFEKQWRKLKAYANRQGISIIGDIPIYVPADSVEVWAHPELFQLREDGSCKAVAGCPPDGFSAIGQLWGNPLYDWAYHEKTGYAWWISRIRRCSELFDIVRIDHFRGFDQYYAIPADSEDARIGQWEDGPGIGLFRAIEKEVPGLTIIAEDLGYITDSVCRLVKDTGYPNMKVLEFAFDSRDSSGKDSYLPFNYDKNCVVYTGTHDNETIVGWLGNILPEERAQVRAFTGLDGAEGDEWAYNGSDDRIDLPADLSGASSDGPQSGSSTGTHSGPSDNSPGSPSAGTLRLARAMVRAAMASVGNLCVIPMQDWLLLGNEARINTPSTTGVNWRWRMPAGADSKALAAQVRLMTETFGR